MHRRETVSFPKCPAFQELLKRKGGHRPVDLTGKRFGRLLVLTYAGRIRERRTLLWLCQCDCGQRRVAPYPDLAHGSVTSCGCRHKTHGQSNSVEYQTWYSMRNRCYKPQCKSYKFYGGRGITICDRWLGPNGFANFFADMGKRPRGKSIDRKNVNGNYEPGNCRWATNHIQSLNKRNSKANKPTTSPQADVTSFAVEEPF